MVICRFLHQEQRLIAWPIAFPVEERLEVNIRKEAYYQKLARKISREELIPSTQVYTTSTMHISNDRT